MEFKGEVEDREFVFLWVKVVIEVLKFLFGYLFSRVCTCGVLFQHTLNFSTTPFICATALYSIFPSYIFLFDR